MQKSIVDFHHVEEKHFDIHDRLLNWARWVQVRPQYFVHPMFQQYRSHAWQWHTPVHVDSVDILDAQAIEKLMHKLATSYREAIKWAYVVRCSPTHARQAIGCTYADLYGFIRDGRQMLCNLLSLH